ncbi:MAG TPA: LLM class flavin-dependent oxidoreductase [Magnetospirillaceae bacterium]|jgi:alkanesulfonate monooxygenase
MKHIRLNAFAMNCAGHMSAGLWTHPRDTSSHYTDLDHWIELAKLLERGKFDGLFLADVLGVYDVYRGTNDAALRAATQVPVNDPSLLVPAMAAATRHLGFAVTCTLSYEPPYPFARRMSTLDHLTKGRIGWNVVTGYLDSAAKGAGKDKQTAHDARYDVAEEYMELVYRLWEGSWEDDAVIRDRATGTFVRPEKVHRVTFEGQHYKLDAIHLSEPSPQRTPLLYQAGASSKGRDFAARHAECVFLSAPSKAVIGPRVADIRARAAKMGRDPSDVLIFMGANVIVAETEAAARAKLDEYRRYINIDGALALLSGWTGIDFSQYNLDDPVTHVQSDAIRSAVEALTTADPGKVWTVRELALASGIGGISPIFIGTPAQVADEMQAWVAETGVDRFNLSYAVMPESFVDVVDLLVPELQRRGAFKTDYAAGTYREKLFGPGRARLPTTHPAAKVRR